MAKDKRFERTSTEPAKIKSNEIANSTITNDHLLNGSITADKFAPGALSVASLADGSVTSEKLANGSVTSEKLANGIVFNDVVVMKGQRNPDGGNRTTYWSYGDQVALSLEPPGDNGAVAILFPSQGNKPSDFAYIVYDEDYGEAGVAAGENSVLLLGSENDGTGSSDHVRVKSRLVVEADMSSSDPTNAFEIKSGNVTSNLFSVSRSGQVLKPNNPAFNVASNSATTSSSQVRTYNVVYLNIGSHYSTSTHRFTAPIAGRYYFEWSSIKLDNASSGVHRQYIRVNGSTAPMGGRHLRLSEGSNYGDGTCSAIIQLNANDYVDIYITSSSTGSYGSTNYTWFQGFLIG